MPYIEKPIRPALFFVHHGVPIFRTYEDGNYSNGPQRYRYTTVPDSDDNQGNFDVRELPVPKLTLLRGHPPFLTISDANYVAADASQRARWEVEWDHWNAQGEIAAIESVIKEALDLGVLTAPAARSHVQDHDGSTLRLVPPLVAAPITLPETNSAVRVDVGSLSVLTTRSGEGVVVDIHDRKTLDGNGPLESVASTYALFLEAEETPEDISTPATNLTDEKMARAMKLRNQALALLKEAQALDNLKPFAVTHSHATGISTYFCWGLTRPSKDEAALVLASPYTPEKNEGLDVEICVPLQEVLGVSPNCRIPDLLKSGIPS